MTRSVLWFPDIYALDFGLTDEHFSACRQASVMSEQFYPLHSSLTQPLPLGAQVELGFNREDFEDITFEVYDILYFARHDVAWLAVKLSGSVGMSPEELVQYLKAHWINQDELRRALNPVDAE
ncbi:MAG: hypothetical protein WAU28_00320 [Candidatus Moraniibacteriota bacterium]